MNNNPEYYFQILIRNCLDYAIEKNVSKINWTARELFKDILEEDLFTLLFDGNKIVNLMQDLENNMSDTLGSEILEYETDISISDIIDDIADKNTDFAWCDIENFLIENMEEVENTISEYGWDSCDGDLHKAAQMAKFNYDTRKMYQFISDMIQYYAYNYIIEKYNIRSVKSDLKDSIVKMSKEMNEDSKLNIVTDFIDQYFETEK